MSRRPANLVRGTGKHLGGFQKFILRGNVVDLAVGVVAGAAFGAVVSSMVEDLITPLIAAIFGQPDFSHVKFTIGEGEIMIGNFLDAVITFFLTMTGVFFLIVKPMNLAASRFTDEPEGPSMRECPECLTRIPSGARRCSQCTSEVAPVA